MLFLLEEMSEGSVTSALQSDPSPLLNCSYNGCNTFLFLSDLQLRVQRMILTPTSPLMLHRSNLPVIILKASIL